MNNYINKVIYGTSTLIDLTKDTITPENLYKGSTAHSANGEPIIGTAEITIEENKLIMPLGLANIIDTTTEIEQIQIGTTTYNISPTIDFESNKLKNKPSLGYLGFINKGNGFNIYIITN